MVKKVIAALFAGLVVVSFAGTAFAGDVSGHYNYKIVCKAPSPLPIINNPTTHSATTIITQSVVSPVNTKYYTVVRSELHYGTKILINSNKTDWIKGKEDKDNKIVAKKMINHSDFKKTYHTMALSGVGANYGAHHNFYSSQTITGTRYF